MSILLGQEEGCCRAKFQPYDRVLHSIQSISLIGVVTQTAVGISCHAHYQSITRMLTFQVPCFRFSQLERRLHRQVGFVPRSMCTIAVAGHFCILPSAPAASIRQLRLCPSTCSIQLSRFFPFSWCAGQILVSVPCSAPQFAPRWLTLHEL